MQLDDVANYAKKLFISIHAPYKGCNLSAKTALLEEGLFQSMHPIKDATSRSAFLLRLKQFQSMHPIKDATEWRQ